MELTTHYQPSSYSDKGNIAPTPNTLKLGTDTITVPMAKPVNAKAKSFWDNDTSFLPGANQLVSASVGLYHWRDKFYMQVITSHNEENYIVEIPFSLAAVINKRDCVEIVNVSDTSFDNPVKYAYTLI